MQRGYFEGTRSTSTSAWARGSAKGAPDSIEVAQVVEHGLRHLSWLSRDDPVIREELSPEWLAVVAEYQPEPFGAL